MMIQCLKQKNCYLWLIGNIIIRVLINKREHICAIEKYKDFITVKKEWKGNLE